MKPDRVLSMLGIAAKAGSVASGEFSTEKAVKEGRAYLVIVAQDASDNTKKMFRNMTDFYQVNIRTKKCSGISSEKNFVHRLQSQTRDCRTRSKRD
mgnify:CR=1 FL=1